MKPTIEYFLLLAMAFFLCCFNSGCSSSNGDQTNATPDSASEARSGKFLDSAVEGLKYRTATQEGITDETGTFTYREGETITFYIGDIVLGQSLAGETLTPVDIVEGAEDASDTRVTNICRFLQTLDEDGNPENGIRLDIAVHNEAEGRSIDFSVETGVFEDDPELENLIETLNSLRIFIDGRHLLISADSAQGHMNITLADIDLGCYSNDDSDEDYTCEDADSEEDCSCDEPDSGDSPSADEPFSGNSCECDDADLVFSEGGSVVCGC